VEGGQPRGGKREGSPVGRRAGHVVRGKRAEKIRGGGEKENLKIMDEESIYSLKAGRGGGVGRRAELISMPTPVEILRRHWPLHKTWSSFFQSCEAEGVR